MQALFFDHDGVLADSVEVKTQAFMALYADEGPSIVAAVAEHHRNHSGMSRYEKFDHYARTFFGRTLFPNESEELDRRFSKLVFDAVVASADIPGVREFLTYWSARVPCVVVSAAPEEELRRIVTARGMCQFFDSVRGSPTVKADLVAQELARLEIKGAQAVLIGDALIDYRAAKAHGLGFVGLVRPDANGRHPLLAEVKTLRHAPDFLHQAKDGLPGDAGAPLHPWKGSPCPQPSQ